MKVRRKCGICNNTGHTTSKRTPIADKMLSDAVSDAVSDVLSSASLDRLPENLADELDTTETGLDLKSEDTAEAGPNL
eukprot:74583-Rhodomonas_salina.1